MPIPRWGQAERENVLTTMNTGSLRSRDELGRFSNEGINHDEVVRMYLSGLSSTDISNRLHIGKTTVKRIIKNASITRNSHEAMLLWAQRLRKILPIDDLYRLHWDEKLTLKEIAAQFNVNEKTIRRLFEENNRAVRPRGWGRDGRTAWWKIRGVTPPALQILKPTGPEIKFSEISRRLNLYAKYTGNGSIFVGNINPDFTLPEKTFIDILGDYWHGPLLRPLMKKYQRLEYRRRTAEKHGWRYVSFWESELNSNKAIQIVSERLSA